MGKSDRKGKVQRKSRREEEKTNHIVCALDPSPLNYGYWIGRLKRPEELTGAAGESLVKDLAMNKFSLPRGTSTRGTALAEHLIHREPLFSLITCFDAEAQNPVTRLPPAVAKRMGLNPGRTLSGNCVAYGIAQATEAVIALARRERGLPPAEFRFTSPRTKFFTLGLSCPPEKRHRKAKSVRWQQEFFHRQCLRDPSYQHWQRRMETQFRDATKGNIKMDDVADTRLAGICRLIRLRAGLDKPKKQEL
jgi:hypothetical protein